MPSDVQYNPASGWIEIVHRGDLTASELTDAACKRIAIQKETGALKVLADASAVQRAPSTVELFNLPNQLYPEQDAPRRTLIAVVLPKQGVPRELTQFLETAASNRGWRMQLFDDRPSAVAWLMEQA